MANMTSEYLPINKTVGVPLTKAVQKTKSGSVIVTGFFTSDGEDMHGDIITRDATQKAIGRYRQWGNIRRMHNPDPVGKVIGIGEEDGLEWNEVKIEVIDPKAAFEVENGLLQALSIGALINFEDITWLENGGMLINDYLLGEISLVDHPANYDAFLRDDNSAKGAVNMLVRQFGLDTVSKGMLAILKENDMTDEMEKDVVETEDIAVEADVDIAETEDVEAELSIDEEVEEVTETEVEVDKEIVEDTDEEVTTDETEIVEDAEVETEVELSVDESVDDVQPDRLENIEVQLGILTDLVKSLVEKEAEVVEENIEEESIEEIQDNVDTEDAEITEIEHKTLIPSDDLDVEDDGTEADVEPAVPALRKALLSRFGK